VIVFGEADSIPTDDADSPALSALRSLLQDNRLEYAVPVQQAKSRRFVTERISRPGPTMLLTTGVKRLADTQMQSRVFDLEIAEDFDQVRAKVRAQAAAVNSPAPPPDEALVAFQKLIQLMAPWDVAVPFAERLAELITKHNAALQPRLQRDFGRIVTMVQAVAVLRHAHRQRDEQGRLVATLEDYEAVREHAGPMYESSATGVTSGIRQALEALRGLGAEEGVSQQALCKAIQAKVGLATKKRWIKAALTGGWIVDPDSSSRQKKRGNPQSLVLGDPIPDTCSMPTRRDLEAEGIDWHGASGPEAAPGGYCPACQRWRCVCPSRAA
jgi:hypothetical protein